MAETIADLSPNLEDMRKHLAFLFGDARAHDDGLIEIAVNTRGGWQSRLFETSALDDAASWAAEHNAKGANAYVGAALRDPDAPPFGRASDADHYATTATYADLDDSDSASAAAARTAGCRPDFVVCTGTHPHKRLQLWWKLDQPITDGEEHRQIMQGLADSLGGDRTVCNPGRIMRLAGSIAWPTKDGRVEEMTFTMAPKNANGPHSAAELARIYPKNDKVQSIEHHHKNDPIERVGRSNSLGLDTGTLSDGRERYMRDTVLAVFIELVGTTGGEPDAQELFDAVWPQYSAKVDLSRPGRGPEELAAKCKHILQRFAQGRLAGLPNLDAVVARYQAKARAREADKPRRHPLSLPPAPAHDNDGGRFQWITRENGTQPVLNGNWLIKRVLPAEGLGVIFGRPGSGKTFTVMDIAMHVSAGLDWRGLKVRGAAVSYVSPEAGRLGVNRVIGWCSHYSRPWPTGFRLSPAAINLCSDATDADALVADIKANQPDCRLVVIDTLNRAMAGGDENSGEDMGRFVALCDHIAKRLGAFVLVVHHSGKDAAKGSRGHSSLLGAVSLEIEVTKEQGQPGTIKITKMRDGEDGGEFGFDIDSVPLGRDEDGEEVTTGISISADVEEARAAKSAEPKGTMQRTVADAFKQFVDDCGRPNPPGVGFAEPGRVMVVGEDDFTEFVAGKLLGGKIHEKRKRARQTISGLVAKGYFVINGGLIWRVR